MSDFAIVAEGYTDQLVIKNVLLGFFDPDWEPDFSFVQPLLDQTGKQNAPSPGGWDQVLKYLELGRYKEALQFNRYLVVHIDTDVLTSEKTSLNLRSRDTEGNPLAPDALIDEGSGRLKDLIDREVLNEHEDRFIFAIAVDAIECWLLPLVFPNQKAKRSKTQGCFKDVDHELAKKSQERLRRGDGKNPDGYKALSRLYTRQRELMKHARSNPSLSRFMDELERRTITSEEPTDM